MYHVAPPTDGHTAITWWCARCGASAFCQWSSVSRRPGKKYTTPYRPSSLRPGGRPTQNRSTLAVAGDRTMKCFHATPPSAGWAPRLGAGTRPKHDARQAGPEAEDATVHDGSRRFAPSFRAPLFSATQNRFIDSKHRASKTRSHRPTRLMPGIRSRTPSAGLSSRVKQAAPST